MIGHLLAVTAAMVAAAVYYNIAMRAEIRNQFLIGTGILLEAVYSVHCANIWRHVRGPGSSEYGLKIVLM